METSDSKIELWMEISRISESRHRKYLKLIRGEHNQNSMIWNQKENRIKNQNIKDNNSKLGDFF